MAIETIPRKPARAIARNTKASGSNSTLSPKCLAEQKVIMARVMEEGEKRIHRSVERLVETGFYDKEGNRLKKDLPPDMLPGADRDFGG
jgi:hypothetical protein